MVALTRGVGPTTAAWASDRRQRWKLAVIPPAVIAAVAALIVAAAFVNSLFCIRLDRHPPSRLLLDRTHAFLAEIGNQGEGFGYWPLADTLPRRVRVATLAAEDRRFATHWGVDPRAIVRAVSGNYLTHANYSGASTVAMQVARLQSHGRAGWYAKIRDSFTAIWITLRFGREAVLRHYLMIAPYGNRIAGVNYAARRYFRKPPADLSWAEAALLAALPRAPGRMNLFSGSGLRRAQSRARLILARAAGYGWLSPTEWREARAELGIIPPLIKESRPFVAIHAVLALEKQLAALSPHPDSLNPTLRTTLDLNLQQRVSEILDRRLPALRERDVGNAAAMVVNWKSGEILAYIGSADYYDRAYSGAFDYAAVPRSTGSLLKPFIYGLGMEWLGYNAATILTDIGFDFGAGTTSYIPENFDRNYLGPVLYKSALANSRNIPAVQVLKDLGVPRFYDYCAGLGLTPDDGRGDYYGLGLAIGGLYTTLGQICRAYTCLPNRGDLIDLTWFPRTAVKRHRVMSPDIAMQVQRFLSDPLARLPGFPRNGAMEYPFAVSVKTGTSEGFRDAWCVGWSDTYLVGVWLGNADNTPTKRASGFEDAAPLVKEILCSLHPDRIEGLEDRQFPPPPEYQPYSICRLSGLLADSHTPYVTVEYFKSGTEPTTYSTVEKLLPVDPRNGLLAWPGCGGPIEYRRFISLAPIFEDWARMQGLPVSPTAYSPLCGNAPKPEEYAISITMPRNGARIFRDPDMPSTDNSMTLQCRVSPNPESILWFINGREYAVRTYPYHLKWPLKPGAYTFQATVPYTTVRSRVVTVEVF
jgi:penicillin-binding protein 1C